MHKSKKIILRFVLLYKLFALIVSPSKTSGDMKMSKVIQVLQTATGDNINSEMKVMTTILTDAGEIFEGVMESVSGDYYNGYKYEMKWKKVNLPEGVTEE